MRPWWGVLALVVVALAVGPAGLDGPVLLALRLPRALAAVVVGAGLALTGTLLQTLLRNALAEPFVLGLSGGATLGAVSAGLLLPGLPPALPAAGGAWLACAAVLALARRADPTRLLLCGVAVSATLGAATGLVLQLAPAASQVRAALFWTAGSLAAATLPGVGLAAAALVGGLVWARHRADQLDRLLLGDETAASLGVPVLRLRRELVAATAALTGALVALAGPVGFVGLAAPHLARRAGLHRPVLALALPLGAGMLLAADTLGRALASPRELPVGLCTAALGGPYLIYALRRVVPC